MQYIKAARTGTVNSRPHLTTTAFTQKGHVMAAAQSTPGIPPLPVVDGVEFRLHPKWRFYCVGSDGTVWSCKVRGGNNRTAGQIATSWRQLAQCCNANGYTQANLFQDGKRCPTLVCHLVLEAFVGPRGSGMVACHFPDRSTTNNRLDNLRWDTRSGNGRDMVIHGTVAIFRGESHSNAKLTENDVLEIVRQHADGRSLSSLSREFGVSVPHIARICRGESWTHVTNRAKRDGGGFEVEEIEPR